MVVAWGPRVPWPPSINQGGPAPCLVSGDFPVFFPEGSLLGKSCGGRVGPEGSMASLLDSGRPLFPSCLVSVFLGWWCYCLQNSCLAVSCMQKNETPSPPIPPFVWGYSPSDVNNFRCHCLRNFFRFPFHLYSIGGLLQPTKYTSQKIFLSPSLVQFVKLLPFPDDLFLLLLFCLCIVLSFCLFVFVIGASLK